MINKRKNPITCTVLKVPENVKSQKTISVVIVKKLLNFKYKRYYNVTYKRLVHYEGTDQLIPGDNVYIYNCRRISAHKSAICYGKKL